MNAKTFLLLLIIGSIVHGKLLSQNQALSQDSIVGSKINLLINDYGFYSSFTDDDGSISDEMIRKYKSLFKSNVQVYNDLPGKNYGKSVGLKEYINNIINNYPQGLSVSAKVLSIIQSKGGNNRSIYLVKVEKEIETINLKEEYLKLPGIMLDFYISCDAIQNECLISKITKHKQELNDLKLRFLDYETDKPVVNLKVDIISNGKIVETGNTNKNGDIVFKSLPVEHYYELKSGNKKYLIYNSPVLSGYEWLKMSQQERIVSVKHTVKNHIVTLELFGEYSFSEANLDFVKNNYSVAEERTEMESAFNYGLKVSFLFNDNDKYSLGVGSGIDIDNFRFNLLLNDIEQKPLPVMVDVDGDNYQLMVDADSIEEKIKINYVSFPVVFKFTKKFGLRSGLCFFFDAGLKFMFLTKSSSELDGNVTYSGKYNLWEELEIYNVDYLDYYSDRSINSGQHIPIKKFNLSGVISTGCLFNIGSTGFSVKAGADALLGLLNISNGNPTDFYFSDKQRSYHSFINDADKITVGSFGFHVGLIYEF
jgi:hypothetical protein